MSHFVDLDALAASMSIDVDRLWPGETLDQRVNCALEELGEVSRAITKRRHATSASSGRCKGATAEQWTANLRLEAGQATILDIVHREGMSPGEVLLEAAAALAAREPDEVLA